MAVWTGRCFGNPFSGSHFFRPTTERRAPPVGRRPEGRVGDAFLFIEKARHTLNAVGPVKEAAEALDAEIGADLRSENLVERLSDQVHL